MQSILNGLISGLGIALLAAGFQLAYLPARVFFVALAGLYTLAPYVYLASQTVFQIWFVSVLLSLGATIGLSLLLEWANHAALARRSSSTAAHLISSLGAYIVLVQVVVMIWGNGTQTLRVELQSTFQFGGVVLTQPQLTMAVVAGALLSGFLLMLFATDIGVRLRALADNTAQFALFGYDVDAHRLIAFGLAGVFAGAASLLSAFDNGFDPFGGLHALILALVAAIIGGRSSFVGPILGGVLLGLIRAEVVWHLSARWQEAVTFILLAAIFLLRPQGLFQQKTRIEATG